MHGRFRDFTDRHVGARERLFNPETLPEGLWPDSPDEAKYDWLLTVIVGFGLSIIAIFFILMLYVFGVVW